MRFLKALKAYLSECTGVSATEFALIAPIFSLLLLGTADMGLFLLEQMRLQNAAHSAAEYVSVSLSDENASTVADEVYNGRGDVAVEIAFSCECVDGVATTCPVSCGEGDYQRRFISVTVTSSYSSLFPYPGLPESLDLSGFARMRVD